MTVLKALLPDEVPDTKGLILRSDPATAVGNRGQQESEGSRKARAAGKRGQQESEGEGSRNADREDSRKYRVLTMHWFKLTLSASAPFAA